MTTEVWTSDSRQFAVTRIHRQTQHAFRNKRNMHSETNVDLKLSIVLYSWARPLTSIVPLSDQEFKWVLLIYQGKPMKCLRVTHD